MKKSFFLIPLIAMLLTGCVSNKTLDRIADSINDDDSGVPSPTAQPITKLRRSPLADLPPLAGDPITIAVYNFSDKTGQRKPNDTVAVLSSAVTQGAEVFLIKALQDAGKGKWFQVIERVG